MRYILTVFLVDTTEPVALECEDGECDKMFQQIRECGLTIRHGQRRDYYPPDRIDHIRAIPKRNK